MVGRGGPAWMRRKASNASRIDGTSSVLFSVGTSGGMKGHLGRMHNYFPAGTSTTVPQVMGCVSHQRISSWLLQPQPGVKGANVTARALLLPAREQTLASALFLRCGSQGPGWVGEWMGYPSSFFPLNSRMVELQEPERSKGPTLLFYKWGN